MGWSVAPFAFCSPAALHPLLALGKLQLAAESMSTVAAAGIPTIHTAACCRWDGIRPGRERVMVLVSGRKGWGASYDL